MGSLKMGLTESLMKVRALSQDAIFHGHWPGQSPYQHPACVAAISQLRHTRQAAVCSKTGWSRSAVCGRCHCALCMSVSCCAGMEYVDLFECIDADDVELLQVRYMAHTHTDTRTHSHTHT